MLMPSNTVVVCNIFSPLDRAEMLPRRVFSTELISASADDAVVEGGAIEESHLWF